MANRHLEFGGLAEIKSWGWSPYQLAGHINQFRQRTIEGLDSCCFVEQEFYGNLLFENESNWRIIFDRPGNILGFWHNIPLTPEGHELSLKGQVCGERITRQLVPRMQHKGWYDTYFFSLSVCPTIRKSLVMIRFSASIIQSLVDLARKEIFVNNITMCFASTYSQLMNRFFLQFKFCAEHVTGGQVHQTHLPTFLKSKMMQISAGRNMKDLIRLYSNVTPPVAASVRM